MAFAADPLPAYSHRSPEQRRALLRDALREAESEVTPLSAVLGSLSKQAAVPLTAQLTFQPATPISQPGFPFEERHGIMARQRRNRSLVVAGSVILSVTWTGAIVAGVMSGLLASDYPVGAPGYPDAATKEKTVTGWMLLGLPVAGPIITGAIVNHPVTSPVVAIVAGLPQIAGLAMIIGGATSNSLLNDRKHLADLHLLPYAGPGSAGVGLWGKF